ncbi:MAG: ABC transporter substrate-binding protein [candidate division WOR-3 bacterium]|jgi:ABC-type nitrate/sulfonate/bicarbonate transport system substrate-binding protein|nr:ABC transporter substrate-binding protein [candidate division WOR-3 bacterium]MCR4422998.1 ABC transporter substrate-binding protein [candidate division WOR-3 bacterium]MDH7518337.1 ABC transporter substrate-binding protein [bacterium]
MTKLLTAIIIVLSLVLIGVILYPQLQENRPQRLRFACDSSVAALPFIVAVQDTLFVKNRIEPEITFYSDPEKALDELFAGNIDVGIFPWSTVFKRIVNKGETLKVFMAVEFRPTLPVDAIAKPIKGKIKTVNDLKDKRVGYPPVLRDYLPLLFAGINLNPSNVKLTELPLPVLPARLAAGEFDAVWVLEPFITQIDFTKFDTLTALTTKYIASPFPAYAIGFSPQFLKNTTKIQRTRLKIALDAAVDRIDAQPGEAKKIVSQFFFGNDTAGAGTRLPLFQKISEINKPGIQALASRMLKVGVLTETLDTRNIFAPPSQLMR